MKTVLIVEDEVDLVNTLEYSLKKEGYRTKSTTTGGAALKALAQEPGFDLVLLDLMLPDMSGIDVCKSIRLSEANKHVAVMMITAKGEEIDRVVGFEVGADDYVVKPFSLRELLLRIKAVLRRYDSLGPEAKNASFGTLRLDVDAHQVWVENKEVFLTALEFRLLHVLFSRRGRVQSRDRLLSDVWGIDADVFTRTVDTHIKRLREKLGPAGSYVETVRGVGYRFVADT